MKRRRALQAIHELRSIAHVIDTHQLTKDEVGELTTGLSRKIWQKLMILYPSAGPSSD